MPSYGGFSGQGSRNAGRNTINKTPSSKSDPTFPLFEYHFRLRRLRIPPDNVDMDLSLSYLTDSETIIINESWDISIIPLIDTDIVGLSSEESENITQVFLHITDSDTQNIAGEESENPVQIFSHVTDSDTQNLSIDETETLNQIGGPPALMNPCYPEDPPVSHSVLAMSVGFTTSDPQSTAGDYIGLHTINGYETFSGTTIACTGDMNGPISTEYKAFRLVSVIGQVYSTLVGSSPSASLISGNIPWGMTSMCTYQDVLYVAFMTSDVGRTTFGEPSIFSLANLVNLTSDALADDWVLENSFTSASRRIRSMIVYNNILYAGVEPTTPGVDNLEMWTYDGISWSLQHNFGTSVSSLPAMTVTNGNLYALIDSSIYVYDGISWSVDHTFTGTPSTLIGFLGEVYVGVVNGSDQEIWASSSGIYSLNQSWTATQSPVTIGGMGIALDGYLYVGLGLASGNAKVYTYEGTTWELYYNFNENEPDAEGVTAMFFNCLEQCVQVGVSYDESLFGADLGFWAICYGL